jgi:hypothetical protein
MAVSEKEKGTSLILKVMRQFYTENINLFHLRKHTGVLFLTFALA